MRRRGKGDSEIRVRSSRPPSFRRSDANKICGLIFGDGVAELRLCLLFYQIKGWAFPLANVLVKIDDKGTTANQKCCRVV